MVLGSSLNGGRTERESVIDILSDVLEGNGFSGFVSPCCL